MKTLSLLVVALLISSIVATPAWGQGGSCYACTCCGDWCFDLASYVGGGGEYGYQIDICGLGCRTECGGQQGEEDQELAEIDLQDLWMELESSDVILIRDALELHPTRVTLNRQRKAVQILGCNNTLVGHITLSEEVATALLREDNYYLP